VASQIGPPSGSATYSSVSIDSEAFTKGPDADRTHSAKNQRHRPVADRCQKVSKDQHRDTGSHKQHVVAKGSTLIGVDVPVVLVAIH